MIATQTLFPRRLPHPDPRDPAILNWAKNATLAAENALQTPENEAQLQEMIAAATGKIRFIGNRMSPGRMLALSGPEDRLIDLSRLRGVLEVDNDSVTFGAGTPLHEMFETLTAMNRMLAASPGVIDAQTLAGAISTGTHGQGMQQSSLAEEGGKPHWGKYYDPTLYDWPALYPQWSAFQAVRQQLDPQGKFLNAFMTELLA